MQFWFWKRQSTKPSEKKYFVLDRDEANPSYDEFHHESVVDSLLQMINENDPPYTIGIFGRWGTGKSTVSNFLHRKLKESDPNIHWLQVSVWRHNPETLPQASYRALMSSLEGNQDKLMEEVRSKLTVSEIDPSGQRVRQTTWRLLLSTLPRGLVYLILAVAAHLVFVWAVGGSPSWETLIQSLSAFAWLPFAQAFSKFVLDTTDVLKVKREISPVSSLDQYADRFIQATQGKRVFVLIDDLDRLAPAKILRVLEIVKSYITPTNNSCVFIIPCDDQILRTAVHEVKLAGELDGDQYLEKFFQFTVRLPQHLPGDLRSYARTLLNRGQSPLLSDPRLNEALSVLMHSDVSTPRQVKKLLNDWASLYIVLQKREQGSNPVIPPGMTTTRLDFIAKMAVLRTDFPAFYHELEKNPGLLEYADTLLQGGQILPHQSQMLESFVEGTSYDPKAEPGKERPENASLIRFLIRTSHVNVPDIRPFLYLRTDKTFLILKDQNARSLAADITSGNVRAVRNALSMSTAHKESVLELALSVLEPLGDLDLQRGLSVLYEVADELTEVSPSLAERVANFVFKFASRTSFSDYRDPSKVVGLAAFCTDLPRRDQFLEQCVSNADYAPDWIRELVMRPELCTSTPRLLGTVRSIVQGLFAVDLLRVVEGVDLKPEVLTILGEESLKKLTAIAIDRDTPSGDDPLVHAMATQVLPVLGKVFPTTAASVLAQLVKSGDSLSGTAWAAVNTLPTWLQGPGATEVLHAVSQRFLAITDVAEFRGLLDWITAALTLVPEEHKGGAQKSVLLFLTTYLTTSSVEILQALTKGYQELWTEDDIWEEFDQKCVEIVLESPGTPRAEALRDWLITVTEYLSEDVLKSFLNGVNSWLYEPNEAPTARLGRLSALALWQKNQLQISVPKLMSAVADSDYELPARREVVAVVIGIYQGLEAQQKIVWSDLSKILGSATIDEFRFGLEIIEQLPWPPPEEVGAAVVNSLMSRRLGSGDTTSWSRLLGLIPRMRNSLTSDHVQAYFDWIVAHLGRDVAVSTPIAMREWKELGSARRASVALFFEGEDNLSRYWNDILTNWGRELSPLSVGSVVQEFEALLAEGVQQETLEQITNALTANLSARECAQLATDILAQTRDSDDLDLQESWLTLFASSVRRAGKSYPDCSHVFVHLLSGNTKEVALALKFLPKARPQLTSLEEEALGHVLLKLSQEISWGSFSRLVHVIRQVSRSQSLLKALSERWKAAEGEIPAHLAPAIDEAMTGLPRKRTKKA